MKQAGLCARRIRATELRDTPFEGIARTLVAPLPLDTFEAAVAAIDGEDVSFAFGRQGWVYLIYTLPDHRDRGAGHAALDMLIRSWPDAACESGTPAGERLVARAGVRDLTLTQIGRAHV